jgi:hypothetical protein
MKDIMAVKQVSREEKPQVMEAIGRNFLKKAHRFTPCLHETLLGETTLRVPSGSEQIFDWQERRKELRKR